MNMSLKDFMANIEGIIDSSGIDITKAALTGKAYQKCEAVFKAVYQQCKETFFDEDLIPEAKERRIREAVQSAVNLLSGTQNEILSESAKILKLCKETALKPVGEKSELEVFRRELKESEVRRHIRDKYANDPIRMQAELGNILKENALWASACLNDVTGEIPKLMQAAEINLEEDYMQANNSYAYNALQEARLHDRVSSQLLNLTMKQIERLPQIEFPEDEPDTSESNQLAAQIREQMKAQSRL